MLQVMGFPRFRQMTELEMAALYYYTMRLFSSQLNVSFSVLIVTNLLASARILSITKSLETQILKQTNSEKTITTEYRTKVRSLFQNLKSNSSLRQNLVAGVLSVERLTTMTSEEMASDERREENQKLQERNIFNAKGAAPKNATTNEFMCGKCKQRKVSYYQMQTRSADEPMTSISPSLFSTMGLIDVAFCRCEVCGNRWKF
jgi:transcription elongation factor S-II